MKRITAIIRGEMLQRKLEKDTHVEWSYKVFQLNGYRCKASSGNYTVRITNANLYHCEWINSNRILSSVSSCPVRAFKHTIRKVNIWLRQRQ